MRAATTRAATAHLALAHDGLEEPVNARLGSRDAIQALRTRTLLSPRTDDRDASAEGEETHHICHEPGLDQGEHLVDEHDTLQPRHIRRAQSALRREPEDWIIAVAPINQADIT